MESRLAVSLGIAVLAHAMAWGVMREPAARTTAPRASVDASIDSIASMELAVVELLPASPVGAGGETTSPAPAAPVRPGRIAKSAAVAAPAASVAEAESQVGPSPAASAAGEPVVRPKIPSLIDLDSPGSHAFILPSAALGSLGGAPGGSLGGATEPSKEVAAQKKLDAQLKGAVDAKDTENGSGFGGPVVSAAHAAAGGASVLGWATFDVATDALGAVTRVRLVDWGGDERQWQGVEKDLGASLSGKKLRVPTGAAGVSVRVKIGAAMRLPSGATKPFSPSVGPGTVGGEFDLADLGQKPKRMVSVQIVAESRI